MKLKIGDYAYWDSIMDYPNVKRRYLIFKVYDIMYLKQKPIYYICKAVYDNQCKYPRDDVKFPVGKDDAYIKYDSLDEAMVDML